MAKGEIYHKFDNIVKKINPENILGRPVTKSDFKDPEFQKIVKAALRRNIQYGVDSLTHNELEGLKYTLGYEIETVLGSIPDIHKGRLNIKAVHDGSLRDEDGNEPTGGEYVTGVLYGDSGFKHLYDICKVLNDNCDIDHRAGVHIHIGSLNWKNEDVVYAYILGEMIEQEMFNLLPRSRAKNKYCRRLNPIMRAKNFPSELLKSIQDPLTYKSVIDLAYNTIFLEVSGGRLPSRECNQRTNHPRGSKCGYDLAAQRYCWLNFVTLIFNTKNSMDAKTLEIRSHSATMNYTKIKNWAKIWCAFCNFVTNYKRAILEGSFKLNGQVVPVNLETICLVTYPRTGSKLVDYMRERKQLFSTADESVDWTPTRETNKTIKQVLEIN